MMSRVEIGWHLCCNDHRKIRFNLDWEITDGSKSVLVPDFRWDIFKVLERHRKDVNWLSFELDGDKDLELESDLLVDHVEITYNNLVKCFHSEGVSMPSNESAGLSLNHSPGSWQIAHLDIHPPFQVPGET